MPNEHKCGRVSWGGEIHKVPEIYHVSNSLCRSLAQYLIVGREYIRVERIQGLFLLGLKKNHVEKYAILGLQHGHEKLSGYTAASGKH